MTTTKKQPVNKREIALRNLKKAHAKTRETSKDLITRESLEKTSESYDRLSYDSKREYTLESSESIMLALGEHVKSLVKTSGTSGLLKNAYGFKSLADTYQNLTKLVYPLGLHKSEESHLSHLLGSVLPDLKAMLQVNVQVNVPQSSGASTSPHVIDTKQSYQVEGRGHPLGSGASGSGFRHVYADATDDPEGTLDPRDCEVEPIEVTRK